MASTRYHGDLYAKTALDRACGLWVRVGSWNDAHHVFVSCDRRVAFGTVLELEDAHPWSGSSGRRHASFTEWLTARRPS